MNLATREHPEARAEIRDAAYWYDDERPELGDDFTDAIDATIRHVRDWPLASPVFRGWDETCIQAIWR